MDEPQQRLALHSANSKPGADLIKRALHHMSKSPKGCRCSEGGSGTRCLCWVVAPGSFDQQLRHSGCKKCESAAQAAKSNRDLLPTWIFQHKTIRGSGRRGSSLRGTFPEVSAPSTLTNYTRAVVTNLEQVVHRRGTSSAFFSQKESKERHAQCSMLASRL